MAIANALQLEAARATPALCRFNYDALITTTEVWSRRTYPLPHYSVFAADTLLYAVTLTFDLEHLQRIVCDMMKLCTKFERNRTIAAELLRFQCLTLWPWTCFQCCDRLWDNFHQVWLSITYPCLHYSVFWCWYVMSSCDLDLWPVDLESSWYIKRHVIKVCTKFERNRAMPGWIIDNFRNFCTRYTP